MTKIIIIGAGIGGLSAAIRLHAAGHEVTVLEKNPIVGGKMYQLEQDGFRFDTGPSVITMRYVFEDLFTSIGHKLDDYLTFEPVEPMTRYFYPDGVVLDVTRDLSSLIAQIEALEPRDVEGYLRFLAYAAQIHRITGSVFIYDKPPTVNSFTKVPVWDWLKADTFRTMSSAINRFVKSSYLRQLLGRFATYAGGSPYHAPATLNVISHVELAGGVWYPRGGIYQIAVALEKLACELGVEIRTTTSVQQIRIKNGQTTGVVLADGLELAAHSIVSNVDVATTYNRLLSAQDIPPSRIQQMSQYNPSCSGFVLMLGVEGQHEALAHHNIFFSFDYRAEFDAIFKQHIPPDDPTIYIAITSKTDNQHAPQGCENWFVLVNVPPLSSQYDWNSSKQSYRNLVLDKLAASGFDIRDKILTEIIWTPHDLERMSGAWRGALYGLSPNNRFAAFLRPHNRSRDVRGLYFVGGTTHPGGGVPMVMLSAKVVADMIAEDGNKY